MAAGTRGKGRPKLTETAAIDRAIRDAALHVLLEHGEAATMNAVALSAGISRKSLYARYPNKEELFLAVIGELLQRANSLEYDTGGSAEDKLRHYIEAAFNVISRPQSQALQRLLTKDPVYIAALRSEMLAVTQKLFLEPLLALLEAAKQSGEWSVDDVGATARAVFGMIFAEPMVADHDQKTLLMPAKQEDRAAFLTSLITRGLAPRQS